MKKLKKIVILVAVNLIVFILLFELIAVGIYFLGHKAFFYTHEKTPLENIESSADQQLTNKRFHPFFGYTHKAGSQGTNNYGFYCPHDYPLKRENKDWFFIGIFGGSVAADFYDLGTRRLTDRLKSRPYYADKEIIYLNYALGGYKQPQQLEILSYFLSIGQELDMAINIDGFNEIVFCFNNNRLHVDAAMPSAQHFLPMRDLMDSRTLTGEKLESITEIQHIKKSYLRIREKLLHCKSAAVYLVLSSYGKYLYKKYRRELVRFDGLTKPAGPEDSIVNVKYTAGLVEPALLASVATIWYRASFNMNSQVTAWGGRYFHFLQPNQYVSKKVFSDEERKTALDYSSTYDLLAKKGYPVLQQAVVYLRQNHVRAFSAVDIFDSVKETLYIDNCCHFNQKGNELFADFIADHILESD